MLSIRRKVKPVPMATEDSRNETLHPWIFQNAECTGKFLQ
jgi:hypothetical protein